MPIACDKGAGILEMLQTRFAKIGATESRSDNRTNVVFDTEGTGLPEVTHAAFRGDASVKCEGTVLLDPTCGESPVRRVI